MINKAILFLILLVSTSSYGCSHLAASFNRPGEMMRASYRGNMQVITSVVNGERNARGVVVTDIILYRVDPGRFSRSCSISERKYLLDNNGKMTGEVNRVVDKTAGVHQSVYSFAMPEGYLVNMRYALVTEFKGCGESFVRVIDEFVPAQL